MFSARQVMCWAKIGQFNIHGRRRSIKLPGLAGDRSCRVSEKSPDESTRRTASPFVALSRRTLTWLSRRRWSRAAHSTNLTTSRSEEKVKAARQICDKGGRNEARLTPGRMQGFHGPPRPLGLPAVTSLLCIETQEGKPG